MLSSESDGAVGGRDGGWLVSTGAATVVAAGGETVISLGGGSCRVVLQPAINASDIPATATATTLRLIENIA
jgi:hypothetical protein